MSKKLILLISLVLVVGPFMSQLANGSSCNILADPNFELDDGSWELWTWQSGDAAIESDPEIQLVGNYLRASRRDPGGSGAAQQFDANEGDILCIQAWVRTSAGATGDCAVLVVCWGDVDYEPSLNNFLRRDETSVIGEPALTGEILEWTFVQMETPPAPAGTVTARIECFNNMDGEGDAYFDEISACWGACPNPKANTPNPFNGSLGVSKTPTLSWAPGIDANSHDVYFGTDYSDVNDATTSSAEYKGNQAADVNSYSPGLLELGETYYWRIDEVNESDPNLWKGDVWNFTVASIIASRPTPSDGEQDVHRYHATLSWVWGADANSHDIYFGTSFSEVNDATTSSAEYKGNQPRVNMSYDPGFLELGQTYYWRIDEVNESGPNIWKGAVWSFTVSTSTNVLVNPGFEDGTGSDPWNEGLTPELWNKFTWGNAWAAWKSDSAQSTFLSHGGDKLFAVGGWVDAGDPWGSGAAIYQDTPVGVIEVNDIVVVSAWARTEVWGTPISALKVEFKDVNGVIIRADESIIINGQQKLTYEKFTVVTDPAPAGTSYAEFLVLGGSPGTILVDDVSLDIGLPVIAWDPSPHHGATSVVQNTDLSWRPGLDAVSHDVYFGTSFAEVNDANTSSSEFKVNQAIDVNSYGPGPLVLDTRYYWRIDEVNGPNTWRGDVWSFTTLDRLIVDYFDSYADTDALLTVWSDYWTNETGAELLLETDPQFTYNGNAMEFFYDNSEKIGSPPTYGSEADASTAHLICGSDWTVAGLKGLVLRFYGDATNSITANDQMYVALEDTSSNIGVLEHPDMNEFLVQEWSEWNIDMEDFNDLGLDLANISKVYIGFGGPRTGQTLAGGSGVVYFDDIEVVRPRCVWLLAAPEGDFTGDCVIDELDLEIMAHDWLVGDYNVVPAAPSPGGLLAYYMFDGNATDSSGNGNDGVLHGGASFVVAGVNDVNDLAIDLDGFGDYMSVPGSNTLGGAFDFNDAVTVAAWIKVTAFDTDFATIISKGDDAWRLARNLNNDQIEFACTGVTSGSIYGHIVGSTNVDDGQWHHVAGVYDGSGLYLYVDGLVDAWDEATGFINTNSYEVYIGENAEATLREWHGQVDDARIYSRGLSHGEIVSLAGLSQVYQPVPSVANISDSEAKFSKTVNFKDYALMADNWLRELLFPF